MILKFIISISSGWISHNSTWTSLSELWKDTSILSPDEIEYDLEIISGATQALVFTGANVDVKGDLTVTGDDLYMGTNTSGYILVADNTNYNPVAVSGDVTLANTGAVTIGATKVTGAMLNDDAISAQGALGGTGLHQTEDDFMFSDDGTLK